MALQVRKHWDGHGRWHGWVGRTLFNKGFGYGGGACYVNKRYCPALIKRTK